MSCEFMQLHTRWWAGSGCCRGDIRWWPGILRDLTGRMVLYEMTQELAAHDWWIFMIAGRGCGGPWRWKFDFRTAPWAAAASNEH